ncbi:MAG: SNF2-related protein [Pseudomonadota bacterium]
MTTPYHAKYFAHELTRQGGVGVERLSRSLFDACVDLNPHQIEAALFAIRSPISKGVVLADEVGLGKTIEAGLVLCQYWAERKRRLLVVCPASIRKQWALELEEKFNLPTLVLDAKSFRQTMTGGEPNPFWSPSIVIASLHFVSRKRAEIKAVPWDLVVIDEAHKLRNAYRQSNRMGRNLCWALEDRRKILLTATPLQNSLLELYGLSTIIDERIFGDLPSFRTQYVNTGGDTDGLRNRLRSFCKRTLRRQVLEYIQYTERKLITRPFSPTEQEHKLYEAISAFLRRDDTYSLPQRQRHLMILVVRKLLASSPQAVAGTLEVIRDRLVRKKEFIPEEGNPLEQLILEEEMGEELLDEILGAEAEQEETSEDQPDEEAIDLQKLEAEIRELDHFIQWARSIGIDTKTRSLIKALEIGFAKMAEMGAPIKAVIFTESRRTQAFLRDFLDGNGYAGKVVMFNGPNRDPESTEIYNQWVETNRDTGRSSGSRPVDIRMALVEHFRDHANILIATEAASEGLNLQFCSLVINFDLPWNPQRVEQRIGRCHRYGQKHDVVVINFLNERNEADRRVYELLNEKFNLFSGVFGVSDEVLGSIESGVDFERRVLDIYQQCRSAGEILEAFQNLQAELTENIQTRMEDTRRMLLEHFDEDVHSRLKANLSGTREQLDRMGRMFWGLTKYSLKDNARFDEKELAFDLLSPPLEGIRAGRYHLISKEQKTVSSEFLYRLSHPLGEYTIHRGKEAETPAAHVDFDYSGHPRKISMVEDLKGRSGWLMLQRLMVKSFEAEEYLLFSAFDDQGNSLEQEACEKLFHCQAAGTKAILPPYEAESRLKREAERHARATIARSLEANNLHFIEAREQLEKWAEDMVLAVEKELSDTKQQVKALNRQARLSENLQEQHKVQEKIRGLEKKKRRQRQRIFDVEDEIVEKRDFLIEALEKRMAQKTKIEPLYTIRWNVV